MTDEAAQVPVHPNVLLGYDVGEALDIARDPERIDRAYQQVFRSNEGRAVLFDMMSRAHMGEMRPANLTDRERAYMDGWAAMVIEVLSVAGVDPYERVAGLHVADTFPQKPMERTHDGTSPTSRDTGGSAGDPDADGF